MLIQKWHAPQNQICTLGRHQWSVARLFELAKDLPVIDVPLNCLNVYYIYEKLKLRDLVMHIRAIEAADMSYPIILDEDGELMDGRHRIMKAMLEDSLTIKVVRFDVNPEPCRILEI